MKSGNGAWLIMFVLVNVSRASATSITYTDPLLTLSAGVDYRLFVNNGGNQAGAGTYIGDDPTTVTHTPFNVTVDDGKVLSSATLDLALSPAAVVGSRVASYFDGLSPTATYNPVFAISSAPQYTITASSSAGINAFTGNGSAMDLDVLSLLNFSTILGEASMNRSIVVTWHDAIDFLVSAKMVKNATSLPGNNDPREYRWSVMAGLTGQGQLNLDVNDPREALVAIPEPTTLSLLGGSLLAIIIIGRRAAHLARKIQS